MNTLDNLLDEYELGKYYCNVCDHLQSSHWYRMDSSWGYEVHKCGKDGCKCNDMKKRKYFFLPNQDLKASLIEYIEGLIPGEKEAMDVASDHDERHCYFSAKNAYLQAIDDMRAKLKEQL